MFIQQLLTFINYIMSQQIFFIPIMCAIIFISSPKTSIIPNAKVVINIVDDSHTLRFKELNQAKALSNSTRLYYYGNNNI